MMPLYILEFLRLSTQYYPRHVCIHHSEFADGRFGNWQPDRFKCAR
jgi:hypothetical protein